MQQTKEKIPNSILIVLLALIVCCLGLILFLSVATVGVVAYAKNNISSFIIFGIALAVLMFSVIKHHRNKKGC